MTAPDLFAPITELASSWEYSAEARRQQAGADPVAVALEQCASSLRSVLAEVESVHAYFTTGEYALLHGVTPQTVRVWCQRRRLPGAFRAGYDWRIPRTTPPPAGREKKSA